MELGRLGREIVASAARTRRPGPQGRRYPLRSRGERHVTTLCSASTRCSLRHSLLGWLPDRQPYNQHTRNRPPLEFAWVCAGAASGTIMQAQDGKCEGELFWPRAREYRGTVIPITTLRIDHDGYITPTYSDSVCEYDGMATIDTIMDIIGWCSSSMLMLECVKNGAAKGQISCKNRWPLPTFTSCHMRLSSDKSHITCYLA